MEAKPSKEFPVQHIQPIDRRDFLKKAGLLAAAHPLLLPGASPSLQAGVSKRKITPPISIPYLTSSANGTCAPFKEIHDDLFARTLVVDDGHKAIAILAVDSIGYDNLVLGPKRHFTRELRQKIAAKTKLHPDAILLSATHAHSTPETIGLTDFRDFDGVKEWLENHLQELADTVIEAWQKRQPVRACFGQRKVEGIARNRRVLLKTGKLSVHGPMPPPDQIAAPCPLDEDLSVLYFETETGAPHSAVLNYTAHPVVTMLLPGVSADYPGTAAARVEQELPGTTCLFTQGAAGNINSIHVTTKYDDATALGQKLGHAALAEIKNLQTKTSFLDPKISYRSHHFHLKPRPFSPSSHRLAQKLSEDPLQVEIQTLRLGPVTWTALPGEPFVETGLALKQAGASFIVGYANGWHGYFPIQRAYAEGGYEVGLGPWSRVAPGSAEALESHAKKELARIKSG